MFAFAAIWSAFSTAEAQSDQPTACWRLCHRLAMEAYDQNEANCDNANELFLKFMYECKGCPE